MRDYDATVKNLREAAKGLLFDAMPYRASVMRDAADAIEELNVIVEGYRSRMRSGSGWISVEDELPKESGYTIVFCADGELSHVTFAKYQKAHKRWDLTGARSYWRVTHWMPLPEPPNGVE